MFKVVQRWNEVIKVQTGKSRKPSFGYDFTIEGKRHRNSGFPTKGGAEAAVGKIKAAIRFGESSQITSFVPTISQLAAACVNRQRLRVSRKRVALTKRVTRRFLEFLQNPSKQGKSI